MMKRLLKKCRTIAMERRLSAHFRGSSARRRSPHAHIEAPSLAVHRAVAGGPATSQRGALRETLPLIVDEVRALGRGFRLDRILTCLSPQPERFLVQRCDPLPSILVVAVLSAAASASDLSDDPPRPAPQIVSDAHEVLLRTSRTSSFA